MAFPQAISAEVSTASLATSYQTHHSLHFFAVSTEVYTASSATSYQAHHLLHLFLTQERQQNMAELFCYDCELKVTDARLQHLRSNSWLSHHACRP